MKKTFYVFRHGETELNAKYIWQGTSSDPDLNARGKAQASDLGKKLEGLGIEKIYTSPFLRAQSTAELVNETLHIPIEIKNDLHECCFGDAEGRTMEEIGECWPELMYDVLHPTPKTWDSKYPGENSESKHQVFERVRDVLLEVAHLSSCETIGISTHGGVMSSLLAGLESYGIGLPNCCVAQVEYDSDADKLRFIGMV